MILRAPKALKTLHHLVELEEHVGKVWHRIMSSTVIKHYPEAAIYLDDVSRVVAIMFRALGGDGGLKIESSPAMEYQFNRTLLQRIAGTNTRFELAWRNESTLNLPSCIDVFSEKSLNYDLYLWLAALASGANSCINESDNSNVNWIHTNQWLSCRVLKQFPGLESRYCRLVNAQQALRPNLKSLTVEQQQLEQLVISVLQNPRQTDLTEFAATLQAQRYLPQPVYLWLYPAPITAQSLSNSDSGDETSSDNTEGEALEPEQQRRYRAEQVEMPDGKSGLVLDRFENIFSWAEYIKVDRTTDEDEDLSSAEDTAKDLDKLSIARDNKSTAKRIRFDLDLPSSESDDTTLNTGIMLPEWDYRKKQLIKDHCSLQEMISADAPAIELPVALRSVVRKLRNQFEALQPSRTWYRGQQQGTEIDLDAYLNFVTEKKQNKHGAAAVSEQGMYREFRGGVRDMACLLLADLSLSTDSWVDDHARVIDVIRDSLFLFAEALSAVGDKFAMYGFSSRYREHIRFYNLKGFHESYTAISRGRINAIKPGFYTRMGAAIRHASNILSKQFASHQLLLILTDGKPNDLDLYDGRYGVEDTRMALIEARRQGLHPFCVTIDEQAGEYLPHMFGSDNYVVIRKPSELPRELPLLYARLSR